MTENPTKDTLTQGSQQSWRNRGHNEGNQSRPSRIRRDHLNDGSTESSSDESRAKVQVADAASGGPSSSSKMNNETSASPRRPPRNVRPRKPPTKADTPSDSTSALNVDSNDTPKKSKIRARRFNAGLTEDTYQPSSETTVTQPAKPSEKYKGKKSVKTEPSFDSLTSALSHALSTPPYPDCPICFSSIHPAQPTWSCSPVIPIVLSSDLKTPQYCWTTFHLKCIRSWAGKSVKEVADAWVARGEVGKRGDWRCPGCQSKRETVPSGYWCFCNSTPEPKLTRLAVPHSCGGMCSRPRDTGCGHPCPLQCHPGPCPSCQVTTTLECYCPRKKALSFRCGVEKQNGKVMSLRNLSCGEVCGRTLSCGKHTCEQVCHDGDCVPCQINDLARCWCGKEENAMRCGEGDFIECAVEGQGPWIGRFSCYKQCNRFFDCGMHTCEKSCHPPSHTPPSCPRSPANVTRCPCGKSTIAPSTTSERSQYDFAARTACTSPIPTCLSQCSKAHPACSHPCRSLCHTGPCPPCSVEIIRPCRCGATKRNIKCSEVHDDPNEETEEILCDRPCTALRACGRHRCRRLCCPLASLAGNVGKKGRKRAADDGPAPREERGGLHECDLTCGKTLSCSNHRCEEKDHKGLCPPCLRSSFEEMICFCGRTVYDPPIPCGTKMQCNFPCPRPTPECGHPSTPHSCHDDTIPCPPCPFLTTKQCACGKKMMPNIKCSLETAKVSCGTVCGRLMSCGFHHCERLCHGQECGPCVATCGKTRKLCLPNHHPCTNPCHAPSSCSEMDPCQAVMSVTCPCGRIRQSIHCGRSTTTPTGPHQASLKCNNDCEIAKRNARLADALGINPEAKAISAVTYTDELVAFGRSNWKFLSSDVERTFAEFVNSKKNTQVLPHMPPDRRKFVHDLAGVYRMDTQMVDQEPHRSVQLLRRLDTRIPTPLLSHFIASAQAPSTALGKLTDLRSSKPSGTQSSSWRPTLPISSTAAGTSVTNPGLMKPSWRTVAATTATSSAQTLQSSLGSSPNLRTQTPPTSRPASRGLPSEPLPVSSDVMAPVTDNWEDDV